eukprot:gene17435-24114_t
MFKKGRKEERIQEHKQEDHQVSENLLSTELSFRNKYEEVKEELHKKNEEVKENNNNNIDIRRKSTDDLLGTSKSLTKTVSEVTYYQVEQMGARIEAITSVIDQMDENIKEGLQDVELARAHNERVTNKFHFLNPITEISDRVSSCCDKIGNKAKNVGVLERWDETIAVINHCWFPWIDFTKDHNKRLMWNYVTDPSIHREKENKNNIRPELRIVLENINYLL